MALASLFALPAPATSGKVIKLKKPSAEESRTVTEAPPAGSVGPRAFDYAAFESRLESLWFQRKAFLRAGRDEDAARQSEAIRAFCREEGIRRLDAMAGALVSEAGRFTEEGHYRRALDSLELAEAVDPGRPGVSIARAKVFWQSDRGQLAAAGQLLQGARAALTASVRDLSLFNRIALVGVVALAGCVLLFSILMVFRYQVPFRHEVEEWAGRALDGGWAKAMGWAVLFLPLVLWFAAGWVAFYWMAITFRFMRRAERVATLVLLVACLFAVPAFRIAVAVYGMTADPTVRTTLESARGEYDPDRIVELKSLIATRPQDPVYRFLIAGLYKSGRYFDEAYAEYRQALELDPSMFQAHVNIGNILYSTGQYEESIASYNRAVEANSSSILAYFNMHLAQSESFGFKEAEESLAKARAIDPKQLGELLSLAGTRGDRPAVIDAELETGSVWESALGGGAGRRQAAMDVRWQPTQLLNATTVVALLVLVACGFAWTRSRDGEMARRCIRCGTAFCRFCKSSREGHEYCTQCLHLFVLGDGLAPETKTQKMYEVERYERRSRRSRRLLSVVLPGSSQLLRGRAVWGISLMLLWLGAWVAWQPRILRPFRWATGLDLQLEMLETGGVPAGLVMQPLAVIAAVVVVVVWAIANIRRAEG